MEDTNLMVCKAWVANWKQQAQIAVNEIYYNREMTTPRLIDSSEEMMRIITQIIKLGYNPVFTQEGAFDKDYAMKLTVSDRNTKEVLFKEIVQPTF